MTVYEEVINVISGATILIINEDLDCDHISYLKLVEEAKLRKIAQILKDNNYLKDEFIAPLFTS